MPMKRIYKIQCKDKQGDWHDANVEISVDLDALGVKIGGRAVRNRSGRASVMQGLIKCRVLAGPVGLDKR